MPAIENYRFETSSDRQSIFQRGRYIVSAYVAKLLVAHALRAQQRRDRAAFMNLVGKDSWVYDDIGVHEGDVDWASKLPIDVNAAAELEKIRLQNKNRA